MLATVVLVGLAAAGLTHVVRAAAPMALLLRKPVACDLCMSWWGSFIGIGVLDHDLLLASTLWTHEGIVAALTVLGLVFGGVAVSLLALKATQRLADVPPAP
jgi:hypothetical protein